MYQENFVNETDLRDCFAMFAMMAVMPSLAGKSIGVGEVENNERFANMCYALSDAMLEARKPKEEGIVSIKKRVRKT
jgi:hypothetical protein